MRDPVLSSNDTRASPNMALSKLLDVASSWREQPVSHLGAVVVFGITLVAARWYFSRGNLPPGPPCLPLVGSLPWLRGDLVESLLKLSRRYGSVFTIYMGSSKPAIVVAEPKVIREALLKRELIDRPEDALLTISTSEQKKICKALGKEFKPDEEIKRGFLEASGHVWQQQRSFIHNAFRQFGIGTADFEPRILEECNHMMELLKHEGAAGPVDLRWILMKAIANVINAVLYGFRREYDDPKYKRYLEITAEAFKMLGSAGTVAMLPFLKHLPGDPFGWDRFFDLMIEQDVSFQNAIEEAKPNRQPGEPRSIIDAYLDQIEKTKDDPNTTFDQDRLRATIANLFGGGSETTTTTLLWGIIFLLHHPEVIHKLQAEVDEVIGTERQPSMKDRMTLPYTEACILEIQRVADILPINAPRLSAEEVQLAGHIIPKGHTVLLLFHAVHHDAEVWDDPYIFRPERFLNEEGKVFGRERIIPFSLGKRNCVGESLAKMELFLFFTSIIQQLEISLPEGSQPPDLTGDLGLTRAPKPFQVCIRSRH